MTGRFLPDYRSASGKVVLVRSATPTVFTGECFREGLAVRRQCRETGRVNVYGAAFRRCSRSGGECEPLSIHFGGRCLGSRRVLSMLGSCRVSVDGF